MEEPEHNEDEKALATGYTSDSSVESQSAQLLAFVLGRAEPPSHATKNNAQPLGNASGDWGAFPADHSAVNSSKGSVDASSASVNVNLAPYHFHGLASTQTQTPTQIIGVDDSQKENEGAHGGVPFVASRPLNPVQVSPKASLTPSRAQSTNGVDSSLSAGASATSTIPQPTKAVSFLSPTRQASLQKAPTKAASTMRYRRHPSPPAPSQDSFAGPTASQDPDLFVATARQFEIPLDQLGRSHSQDRSLVESRGGKSSVISSEPGVTKQPMDDYSLSSSSSAGNILVANSDSSGPSQDSHRENINVFSISQEPTQILGDASDVSQSEHADNEVPVNEIANREVATQIIDDSMHVEPVKEQTSQEATQLIEQSPSMEVGTSPPEPSVVSHGMSALSLVPPEKRHSHMRHFADKTKSEGPSEPSPQRDTSVEAVEATLTTVSPLSDKRSLLNFVSPEKRARYMHHFTENSAPVSEASRMATAGTSLGNRISEKAKSPPPVPVMEEAVQDSELQVEMEISPVKGRTNHDQEVIPASESEAADCSREDDELKMDLEAIAPMKSPPSAKAKGKQRAEPSPRPTSPRKLVSTERGKRPASPTKLNSNATNEASLSSPGKAVAAVHSVPYTQAGPSSDRPVSAGRDVEMQPPKLKQVSPARAARAQPGGSAKGKAVARGNEAPQPVASTSAATMRRGQHSPTPALLESEQDSPEIPLARLIHRRKEEEEESEAEGTEGGVPEEEDKPRNAKAGPSTRKRKRRTAALTTKKAGKGKAPASRKSHARATSAAPPPSKKARTVTARKFGAGLGTQVFALFKSDSSFYGAEVHQLNGNRAHVKFFDGLEDASLGVAQMRRFELRKGDIVIPGNKTFKAKVIDDSLWATENEVSVEYLEGPEEDLEFNVPADGLRIPARIVQSQWKDRTLDVSEIIPAVQRKALKDTPSPSKNSVMCAGSTRTIRNKLLSRHGIIITQGPGNQNWSREKEKYVNIVKENGGTVLSDWTDILTLQGKHTNGNKRWTIQRSDVKYAPKDKNAFDRVFLISDVHNQKPKFLLALALGIPCVSVNWLDRIANSISGDEDNDEEGETHWSNFLLAAGHSEPLGARLSQMVDLDWGSTAEHLTEIMENPVPHKVLSGASVLCIGSDLFPHPTKKGNTDADRYLEASRTVPRIILAMGADRVEAVTDAKHASEDLSSYDYVVVKEAIPVPRVEDATYVDVTWIKECLIAGRLLPLPE